MRLIDADALIKWLDNYYDSEKFTVGHICNMVKDMPTIEPESLWTSCYKRLPETNGYYLITGRQGSVNKRKFEDGRWYGNWAVTAWMSLPEPYRGDEDA